MQRRDISNEVIVALAAIGMLALALTFGVVLTLSRTANVILPSPIIIAIGPTKASVSPAAQTETAQAQIRGTQPVTVVATEGATRLVTVAATQAIVQVATTKPTTQVPTPRRPTAVPTTVVPTPLPPTALPATNTSVPTVEPTVRPTLPPTLAPTIPPAMQPATAQSVAQVETQSPATQAATASDTPTNIPTASKTPTVKPSETLTNSPAPTTVAPTATTTNTSTPVNTKTFTPTSTPIPTRTATSTPTSTPVPSSTPTFTDTATNIPPTDTESATATDTLTDTPTDTPTYTAIEALEASLTAQVTPTASMTPPIDIGIVGTSGTITYVSVTPGPQQGFTTEKSPTTCAPRAGWVVYIVQQGDTLFSISRQVGLTVGEMQAANCLPDASTIYAGQVIFIPAGKTITQNNPNGPTSSVNAALCPSPDVRITSPSFGATVSGIVPISGTARDANFSSYKLEFLLDGNHDWVNLGQFSTPVTNGLLGKFDPNPSRLPSGGYSLRLTVFTTSGSNPAPCVIKVILTR